MILTESEARTKWCPMARESGAATGVFWNKPYQLIQRLFGIEYDKVNDYACYCIASECMAWRWVGYRADDGSEYPTHTVGDVQNAKAMGLPRTGCCGLAGTP